MIIKNKLIYVIPKKSPFIQSDVEELSRRYIVLQNSYDWTKKWLIPWFLLMQTVFIIKHSASVKAILISFGGYWSVIPTILGKAMKIPVHIILNGTDCAAIPELNYGNLLKKNQRRAIGYSYENATTLLPVSNSLIRVKNTFLSETASVNQGYANFFPHIVTRSLVIPNGFNTEYWKKEINTNKEAKTFISVFATGQFQLKGGDLILELSKKRPDLTFYIAGATKPEFLKEEYNNVNFLGRLTANALRNYYSRSQYYFQLSAYEGFGCSLCEAMLCECIPIGSSVNIIPEIIGDTGFILPSKSILLLEALVNKALELNDKGKRGKEARNRIVEQYPIQKRINMLVSVIDGNNEQAVK